MQGSLHASLPTSVDQQAKRLPRAISLSRMAAIQEEISEIDIRLLSLRSAENLSEPHSDAPLAVPDDNAHNPAVMHMLAVEICQLAAANDPVGVRALLNSGADPDSCDYDMRTPLHLASTAGYLSVATLLLEYGADPTLQDRDNKTALQLAEEGGHDDVARLLLTYTTQELQSGVHLGDMSLVSSPFTPSHPDFSQIPHAMMGSLVVIMVGLPGRGKTFIARQILRYFQWNGLQTTMLTHESYRKNILDTQSQALVSLSYEDEARVAKAVAYDVASFLHYEDGVVVIDDTHDTSTRRMALLNAIKATGHVRSSRIVFVEVAANDSDYILQNINRAREGIPDTGDTFVEDYLAKIEQHRAIYQSLHSIADKDLTYIRIEGEKEFSLNNIFGWMPSRLTYMLQNLSHASCNIYLTRPGEYVGLVANRLGGNSRLTSRGVAYSEALFAYFKRELQTSPFAVMSSCALRCTETVRLFEKQSTLHNSSDLSASRGEAEMNCRVAYLPTLDEVNHGDCDGMLLSDVHKTMPMTVHSMQADPYHTAWPNGECLHQVFNSRLEPHIHDMQGSSVPLLVVSHLHLLQGLYSYFVSEDGKFIAPQDAYRIDIPLECVVKIRLVGVNRVAEIINLSDEVDHFCTDSTDCWRPYQDNCNVFRKLINHL